MDYLPKVMRMEATGIVLVVSVLILMDYLPKIPKDGPQKDPCCGFSPHSNGLLAEALWRGCEKGDRPVSVLILMDYLPKKLC